MSGSRYAWSNRHLFHRFERPWLLQFADTISRQKGPLPVDLDDGATERFEIGQNLGLVANDYSDHLIGVQMRLGEFVEFLDIDLSAFPGVELGYYNAPRTYGLTGTYRF